MKNAAILFLKRRSPSIYNILRRAVIGVKEWRARLRVTQSTPEAVFRDAFLKNRWGDRESASGSGSNLIQTAVLRTQLPALFKELEVKSILDIPCGDFHWMSQVRLPDVSYCGADVVPELIERVRSSYPERAHEFRVINLLNDPLPKADVVFCRDCLVHLSFKDIFRALANIKQSRAKYLLTTTFTAHHVNTDIPTGLWRPLNLERAPFLFPPPSKLLIEECTEGGNAFPDKSLGVWLVDDLSNVMDEAYQPGCLKR